MNSAARRSAGIVRLLSWAHVLYVYPYSICARPAYALMPRAAEPDPTITTRVLRLRIKDKHAPWLREMALHVNQVWNYCNELGFKVWLRERRFMSGFDFAALCSPLQPFAALCSLYPRGNEGRPAAPFPNRAGS